MSEETDKVVMKIDVILQAFGRRPGWFRRWRYHECKKVIREHITPTICYEEMILGNGYSGCHRIRAIHYSGNILVEYVRDEKGEICGLSVNMFNRIWIHDLQETFEKAQQKLARKNAVDVGQRRWFQE